MPEQWRTFILWRNTIEHLKLYVAADMFFVAQSYRDVRPEKVMGRTLDLSTEKPVVYLQHGTLSMKVIGYNGTTPLNITVKNGVIENIEVLPNQESPGYLKRAKDKVLPQYIGKTVAEAKKLDADIATGATYTSKALIQNIQMGLDKAKSSPAKKKTAAKKRSAKKRR